AVTFFAWNVLQWRAGRFIVTDKRLMRTAGTIKPRISMIPITRVTDVSVLHPPLGRILGYGTLIVDFDSTSQKQDLNTITYLYRAEEVFEVISMLVFSKNDSPSHLD